MKGIPIFQVDAFTGRLFSGNPAAVCPLAEWLEDSLLQAIARENNLSETAFFVHLKDNEFQIRWFTPTTEVDLCGHATLASAFVIFRYIDSSLQEIVFHSRGGLLKVRQDGDLIAMDFPVRQPSSCKVPQELVEALGRQPQEVLSAEDYLVVFAEEEEVRTLRPDFQRLRNLDLRGVIVTARARDVDFVSRFFAPKLGVDEDPVTGSAHCVLTPYWANRLNKDTLVAHQLSDRGGELFCTYLKDRVIIAGRAVLYMKGNIYLMNG